MSVFLSPLGGAAAQFFDNNGVILSGGKIYTYAAGTTTPQTTYTSSSGATAHANPIVLDSAGRVPGGEIWLTNGLVYKFTIETSAAVLLGTYDNVSGINAISINATNVEYDPPFTGALTSGYTVADKLEQTVSVKDFGAVGDGVTNDTAAIQAAITASNSVYFPQGLYILNAVITGGNKNLNLVGDGIGVTILRWSDTGGFNLSFDGINQTLTMSNMTIQAAKPSASAGTAILATWPYTASSVFPNCVLDTLEIAPADGPTQYWANGIILQNAWNGKINNVLIRGKNNSVDMDQAIALYDRSNDFTITNTQIYFAKVGVTTAASTEGTVWTNSKAIYVNYGGVFNADVSAPGLIVRDTHVASLIAGIITTNKPQSCISGCLIYKRGESTSNWVGIQYSAGSDDTVTTDNCFVIIGGSSGAAVGIALVAGSRHLVSTNVGQNLDTLIEAQASSFDYTITNNRRVNGTITVLASGTGTNIISNNAPIDGVTTFAANATTPSVNNSTANFFNTANSSATTILTLPVVTRGKQFPCWQMTPTQPFKTTQIFPFRALLIL